METFFDTLSIHPDNVPRSIVFLTSDYIVEFSNAAFCQMMGMSRSEVHGLNLKNHIYSDDLETQMLDIERFMKREIETFEANQRMFRKDGSMFWVHKNYYHFYNENNELIYWVIVYTEIPEPIQN